MSLPALRQAAFSARRTFTVGSDTKRPDGSDAPGAERARKDTATEGVSIQLEQHWQQSIDAATD
jgi:hypothetical protein